MDTIRTIAGLVVLSAFVIIFACAPEQKTVNGPKTEALVPAKAVREAGEDRWEETIKAAKKEGRVNFVSTAGGEVRNAMSEAFYQKYGISAEAIGGRGPEIAEKILRERKAGIYGVDVYIGGPTTVITQLKPAGVIDRLEPALILPDLKDPDLIKKSWLNGSLPWLDRDRSLLSFTVYPSTTFAINTDMVKLEEVKSWQDLLHPKWKGKMVLNDPTIAGAANTWFGGVLQIMGIEFMQKLAQQELIITRDQRQQIEWLAHGKYPVVIAPDTVPMTAFQKAGSPISYVMPVEGTGVTSGHGNISLINRAPHPASAILFINWLLSNEGQAVFSKAILNPSARVDVSTDWVDPAKIIRPGVKYYYGTNTEEFHLAGMDAMKKARDIFGNLLK